MPAGRDRIGKGLCQNSLIFLLPLLSHNELFPPHKSFLRSNYPVSHILSFYLVNRSSLIVFLICSRSVHVLFPYHLRFASGDTLFFLWLAWAEEGGILGSAIGVMFDLLLPFSKGWQTQKGHANFGTSFLLVCAWVSYRVSIQTQYILHTDSLFPGSFLRFLPIPSLL